MRDVFKIAALVLLAALRTATAGGIEVTVLTIDGEERKETLAESNAGLKLEGTTALKDVAEITLAPRSAPAPGNALYLRNGDVLYNIKIVSGDDSKVKITTESAGALTIDNKFIHAFTFSGKDRPSSEAINDFLKGAKSKEDLLLLPKGDTNSGYVEKFSDKEVTFNAGGQTRAHAFEAVAALRLAPLEDLKAVTDPVATVELRDGSRITGKITALAEKTLKIETLTAQTWPVAIDSVSSIEFKGGKLVYVSDLAPASVEQKPFVGGVPLIYKWRKDKSATGGKLSSATKEYERGIGVHSYCKLTYELGGQFAKFMSDAALDNAAPSGTEASWKVLVDGKTVAEGVAKSGEKPQAINVDVKGAQKLELICDYGPDASDAGDLLNWGGARLIKP